MTKSILPSPSDLTPEQREIYSTLPLNLTLGLLLTHSSTQPYLALGRSFHDGRLPAATRELIILRVAARTGSAYECFHHISLATATGLTDDTINFALTGAPANDANAIHATIRFVDELIAGIQSDPPDLQQIRMHFADNEIAEIALLVGHYVMTALFTKALDIQSEKNSTPHPADATDALFKQRLGETITHET